MSSNMDRLQMRSGSRQIAAIIMCMAAASLLKMDRAMASDVGGETDGSLPPVMNVTGGSLLATLASAAPPNLITNGSFENTSNTFVSNGQGIMSLAVGSTVIPGWTIISAPILWMSNSNVFGPRTPSGSFFLDLTGFQDNSNFAGVRQTIATIPGQQYKMTLDIGSNASNSNYRGPMSVSVSAGSSTTGFTFTPPTGSTGNQWGNFTFDFTATSSFTPISITGTSSTGGQYLALDNIAVVSVVPEPSSLALAMGLLGLAGWRERRRRPWSAAR